MTSSFGVATLTEGINDSHELPDRADKGALRGEGGPAATGSSVSTRSRTIFQQPSQSPPTRPKPHRADIQRPDPLPRGHLHHVAALAHRDPATAEHSRARCQPTCVFAGQGARSRAASSYVLEIAGLLHDVGKLGIPDAILNKPGRTDGGPSGG